MRYLLDTNHAYLLMSWPALPGQKRMDVAYVLCTPVVGENRRDLLTLVRSVEIVDYDMRFVEEFGRVRAWLRAAGKAVSQVDVQLAAIARALELPILTADRDFGFIPDVTVEDWLA